MPHEAVIITLQHAGAAEVDQGLSQLLQALLSMTHTRHLTCTLIETGACPEPTPLITETAGLCSVEDAPENGGGVGMAWCEYEIRPGRHLRLDFSQARPEHTLDLSAVTPLLRVLHRWLIWLDLSHGPINGKGRRMPRHQRKVLLMLLKGLSEKQIAASLHQSVNTTHQYVTALYRRYRVHNRASLMALWLNLAISP